MNITDLLQLLVESRASDLHLVTPGPPVLRIDGELVPQRQLPELSAEDIYRALAQLTDEEQRNIFAREMELDFALSLDGVGRFRANASVQRGATSLSFRVIRSRIPDFEELGLPEICKALALKEHGLVLVTGPAGSGKSTTLAAMIEYLNNQRCRRVITIEDPIEFLHQNKKCFITQREVGADTKSFAVALKHALRQDPDVLLVGEMRDLETIATVLTAAETGHLVLTTLHTPSAPQAIDRTIDVFPSHQQQQVRIQLSTTLQAAIYQTLIPKANGSGRVVAVEVMIANDAIRNLIREAKTPQMANVMQTGFQHGMQTLDQALFDLYSRGLIHVEEAILRSRDPDVAKKTFARAAGRSPAYAE